MQLLQNVAITLILIDRIGRLFCGSNPLMIVALPIATAVELVEEVKKICTRIFIQNFSIFFEFLSAKIEFKSSF